MVVPDFLFDVLLFGLLGVALLLDFLFPQTFHGVATALALALITYSAAGDLSRGLARRGVWSQDSLATSVALCALGFLFFFNRNDADIVLVVLSIGLMMASLMALIAIVACVGACWHERSSAPFAGLLLTVFGALSLGIGAGMLALLLTSNLPIAWRFALVAFGFVAWKVRGMLQKNANLDDPTRANDTLNETSSTRLNAREASDVHQNDAQHGWILPTRGTVLDRVLPLLILGALTFTASQLARRNLEPTSGAQANMAQANTAQTNAAKNNASQPQTSSQTSP